MIDEKKIIDGLNDLLAKNYDAEKGYKNAAKNSDNLVLQAMYRGKAQQRYDYGHQIKDILREMEGDIDKGTTFTADLHRAWIDFKNILSLNDEKAILEEVERGEEAALEEYNEFLNMDDIPQSIKRIVTSQRNGIAYALDRVEEYEEKYINS